MRVSSEQLVAGIARAREEARVCVERAAPREDPRLNLSCAGTIVDVPGDRVAELERLGFRRAAAKT